MDDGSWQDNLSDYNSDFSMPSDQEDGNNIFFSNFTLTLFATGGGGVISGAPNGEGSWQDNFRKTIFQKKRNILTVTKNFMPQISP